MSRINPEIHPLFTEDIIKALNEKKIYTIIDFVNKNIEEIIKITRLTFKDVLKCRRDVLRKYSAKPKNGFDLYKNILSYSAIMPSGIKSVDRMLEGGLCSGNIYELCGLPCSGKTQFALTLCKNIPLMHQQQYVYYLDTKGDFRGMRLKNMLSCNSEDKIIACLEKILVKQTVTRYDLINSLYEIKNEVLEGRRQLRLIIIDSLAALFLNSSDTTANNAFLNQIANILRYLSVEHHMIVFMTNLITSWNGSSFKIQQETQETVRCGKYWSTIPSTRVKIEKTPSGSCLLSILNSYTLSDLSQIAKVVITEHGVIDCL